MINHISQPNILLSTGERMIPEGSDPVTFWEHIYRYRFATQFIKGKKVLDIACGEGYGTAALLKAGAESIVGVDISESTCMYAGHKYGINAQVGRAEQIPLPNQSMDVIVSFETIEHLSNPEIFLSECYRVLVADGLLVISTPNKQIYNRRIADNPFHQRELEINEFISLLSVNFKNLALYAQQPTTVSPWSLFSLSSTRSPWLQKRGFARLLKIIKQNLCAHLYPPKLDHYRLSPVKAILQYESLLSSFFNNYAVRRFNIRTKDEMTYIIAVAVKKGSLCL